MRLRRGLELVRLVFWVQIRILKKMRYYRVRLCAQKVMEGGSEAVLIDGKNIADRVTRSLACEVKDMQKIRHVRPPKLGYALVGDNPESAVYVKMKKKA